MTDRERFRFTEWARASAGAIAFGMRRVLGNELGQMSVFLALVFQVLFVFFAMVINIGLLVHDKINLQNSVDLGAYYAAQKQAELLNEIAHLNYQIRQDYKLLAWRVRVVGTLGRSPFMDPNPNAQPARQPVGTPVNEVPRIYENREEMPVVCSASRLWYEFAQDSGNSGAHFCYRPYGFVATPIPNTPMMSTPLTAALNALVASFAAQSQSIYAQSCLASAADSWKLAMFFLADYKYAISRRKQKIEALRALLVSQNLRDQNNDLVLDGVRKTVSKNLTEANRESLVGVEMINGLTRGGCDGGAKPGENTLPEIETKIGLSYARLTTVGVNPPSCAFDVRFQNDFRPPVIDPAQLNRADPTGILRLIAGGEPQPGDPLHSTLGYEKNPWCMAWMGVRARTKPRKPFAPFGGTVQLEARAFAQPFGGRIGPWYSKAWEQAANRSREVPPPPPPPMVYTGPMPPPQGQSLRVDPLTSPRTTANSGNLVPSPYDVPNFSRFPGDSLGLRSMAAQAQYRNYFTNLPTTATAPTRLLDQRMSLYWFAGFANLNQTGDPGAYDPMSDVSGGTLPPGLPRFRLAEQAAVAPDLFDITYYSIDPRAQQNYTGLETQFPTRYQPMRDGGVPIGDIGSRFNHPQYKNMGIEDQVAAVGAGGIDPTLDAQNFWHIRDWRHILTGWAPHRATNFSFPVDRFGKCGANALPTVMIPGGCVAGGRTGYSVRIVSRSHLLGDWLVGGEGVGAQPIRNQPPADQDF